jgi:hypothetical protein
MEREYIEQVLREEKGLIDAVAARLGVDVLNLEIDVSDLERQLLQ